MIYEFCRAVVNLSVLALAVMALFRPLSETTFQAMVLITLFRIATKSDD